MCITHGFGKEVRLREPDHMFRLGRQAGEGVFCGADGLWVGGVALLERESEPDAWRPRTANDLDQELSRCYGLTVGIKPKLRGLKAVARALDDGDVARAQITALYLRLPDPPNLAKSANGATGLVKLAQLLNASGLLKDWDENKHPRWPAKSPDSQGGRFADQSDGDLVHGGEASLTPAQFVTPIPEPFGIPAPFGVPAPSLPDIPYSTEVTPPPITGPMILPRQMPQNPYPNRRKCVKEWAQTQEFCRKLFEKKMLGKGDYRGMGKFMYQCLKGQVSADCGGNALEA